MLSSVLVSAAKSKKYLFNFSTIRLALVMFVCFNDSFYPLTIPTIKLSVGLLEFRLSVNGFFIFITVFF